MKSYTDIEQSKKLKEILPFESADMEWLIDYYGLEEPFSLPVKDRVNENEEPCWSLAALLEIIRKEIFLYLITDDRGYSCHGRDKGGELYVTTWHDTPIDACVEIIIKLKELNLL